MLYPEYERPRFFPSKAAIERTSAWRSWGRGAARNSATREGRRGGAARRPRAVAPACAPARAPLARPTRPPDHPPTHPPPSRAHAHAHARTRFLPSVTRGTHAPGGPAPGHRGALPGGPWARAGLSVAPRASVNQGLCAAAAPSHVARLAGANARSRRSAPASQAQRLLVEARRVAARRPILGALGGARLCMQLPSRCTRTSPLRLRQRGPQRHGSAHAVSTKLADAARAHARGKTQRARRDNSFCAISSRPHPSRF